jgi:hypothetical protein
LPTALACVSVDARNSHRSWGIHCVNSSARTLRRKCIRRCRSSHRTRSAAATCRILHRTVVVQAFGLRFVFKTRSRWSATHLLLLR